MRAEHRVKLDRVRRDAHLAVLEIEEGDARDLRSAAKPNE
jgi:hypothetical protein